MTAKLNWPVMAQDELVVHGAREHNLKDITVRLPRHKLICVTGLSGSGSRALLRHDLRRGTAPLRGIPLGVCPTVPADDGEAGRGLDRRPQPGDLDRSEDDLTKPEIHGGHRHEIYDYLRLLYARVGRPTARFAAAPSPASRSRRSWIRSSSSPRAPASRSMPLSSATGRASTRTSWTRLRRDGFTRVKVDGEQRLLEEEIPLDKKFKHTIEVVVDRLRMKAELRSRLFQSVETAVNLAEGLVVIDLLDEEKELTFSERFACPEHGVSLPELQPRIFSFNSPHGACPRCTGLGAQQEIDPDLLVPDPTVPLAEALVPLNGNWYEAVIQAIADRCRDRPGHPVAGPDRRAAGPLPPRHQGRADLRQLPESDGPEALVHARVRRPRHEPPAPLPRDRLVLDARADRGVHELPALPECNGARLKPDVLAVTVGGNNIPPVHEDVRRPVARLPRRARPDGDRAVDRRTDRQGDPRATDLPRQRRGRYLQLDRASATLSGGEAQRLRLATQIGSQLVGVLYILDEPSIGLHRATTGS